jgi:hypothetical protein
VLVVVASSQDRIAAAIAGRWASEPGSGGAAVLTCRDLSVAGWSYRPGQGARSRAVVGGRRVAAREIEGVLVRLPHVPLDELAHIAPDDREYVAEEMRAFLLSWLSDLPCPVLNRPTPTSLAGPGWSPAQWIVAATRVGLRVGPVRWHFAPDATWLNADAAAAPSAPAAAAAEGPAGPAAGGGVPSSDGERQPPTTPGPTSGPTSGTAPSRRAARQAPRRSIVTVVGQQCFGTVDHALADGARRLAAAAGADLLAVHFDGPAAGARLVAADLWPDVSPPDLNDAVAAYLRAGHGRDGSRPLAHSVPEASTRQGVPAQIGDTRAARAGARRLAGARA